MGSSLIGFGAKKSDRPPFHPGTSTDTAGAENQYGAGDHAEPSRVAARTPDSQSAASHGGADLIANVAADQDRAVGHSFLTASIGRSEQMPRIARDPDQAPVHLAADPIAGVSLDLDPATRHFASDVASQRYRERGSAHRASRTR